MARLTFHEKSLVGPLLCPRRVVPPASKISLRLPLATNLPRLAALVFRLFFKHPNSTWAGLLLLGLLIADVLLFPLAGAAGAALLLLIGLMGAALIGAASRVRVKLPGWILDLLILVVIGGASAQLFRGPWNTAGFRMYDWGPHHANLRHLVDGLREGRVPAWVHSVSTGDSPYELYALLPYYLAAKTAILTQATDLTLVMVRSGILVHTLAALGAALLARRATGLPWAIVVGFATLYDFGSVWGGGIDGLLGMGVTHSALGNAIWPFVLLAIIGALRRPRLWKSVAIWALVALAIACHPLALVIALATCGALLLVALLARDIPAHRALFAIAHVTIGVLLVAVVWAPFSERLVLYGVHFGVAGQLAWSTFEHMLSQPVPETSVAAIVYAGYWGILVGVLSRRAVPTLLACFAAILMVGLFDQVYTLLDLVPSLQTARFQTVRLASSAKVGIYVCGVYLLDSALRLVQSKQPQHARPLVGALLALATAGILRGGLPYFDRLASELRARAFLEVPDSVGLEQLASWAREQNSAMRPERYGRLLHQDDGRTYLVYHVNARSDLPSLWVGPVSALFLRERIEDASAASLQRFNVRWVMRLDRAPSYGDPATERRFGRYIVRELPDWDGRFARVERGAGDAVVTHLDDERIDVELRGTSEPALVAFGMGYYPRWQAEHAGRGALPVYALPTIEGGQLNVVAAWLPPGHTTLRPSGALPSDGKGRAATGFAALLATAIIVVWSRASKARTRLLLGMARLAAWLKRHRVRVGLVAASVLVVTLLLASAFSSRLPAPALQVGNALRAGASVEARAQGSSWTRCSYRPLYGAYRCPGPVLIQDTVADLLNDAPPSPAFAVPAINVAVSNETMELRVSLKAKLEGEYWAATNGIPIQLAIGGEPDRTISGEQTTHFFEAAERAREITLSATVAPGKPLQIAFVRRDRLVPERGYATAPEHSPFE